MDHGFSEVINKTKVFELHEKFFQLPFQATKCKLAGESDMDQHISLRILNIKEQENKFFLLILF